MCLPKGSYNARFCLTRKLMKRLGYNKQAQDFVHLEDFVHYLPFNGRFYYADAFVKHPLAWFGGKLESY
ncbi:hypothetical protein HUJ05_002254 [Dendroctonus ponderosae]|nr:hypothetical protein HUJ05_002254 [Dendroctonus ponderosae]